MKKQITLTNDTIYTLRNLITEIDYEESLGDSEETNGDLVTENLYKILDIVRGVVQ
jgi:hypothetical protein